MAVFDESKVINSLHKDKAEIGKKYYCADYFGMLKERVEDDDTNFIHNLTGIDDNNNCCFRIAGSVYALIYPYEEPPKKLMTYRQLAEWLARGNGQCRYIHDRVNSNVNTSLYYPDENSDASVDSMVIRPWNSDEWIEPTVDIYERDCK